MTSIIHDFKSIRRKLERQEQKAEYEAKNPEPAMYGWPYGVACPMAEPEVRSALMAIPTYSPAEYNASFEDPLGSLKAAAAMLNIKI